MSKAKASERVPQVLILSDLILNANIVSHHNNPGKGMGKHISNSQDGNHRRAGKTGMIALVTISGKLFLCSFCFY